MTFKKAIQSAILVIESYKIRSLSLFAILAITFISCNTPKMKVDLIVTNAIVYTVNDSFAIAESFAVLDGKFIAVGTNDEISSKYQPGQTINCGGKPVYPGFNDAHCHFFGYGMELMQYANISGTENKESVYKKIQDHYAKSHGNWLLGRGWDQNLWPEKEFPDNKRLNELFPDVPVYLIRIDGHAAWCNAKALQMSGITSKTKINGGDVLLKDGQPTGVLIDNAKDFVFNIIPEPTKELKIKALLEAQRNCSAVGLTSVTDCGLPKKTILLIDSLQNKGLLKMRVNAMIDPSTENMNYFLKKGPYRTDLLKVNTIKLYADGALGSRGAYMLDDYSDDPGNRGFLMNQVSYYDSICRKALAANFQVATHCIGDAANRFILNIYGRILKGKNDRRWRIEHVQVVQKDDLSLFEKFSVVPSIQATHATSDMLWADKRLGPDRLKTAYAYQQLLIQNGWLPNGTDFPIEEINPMLTFHSSVFRKNSAGLPTNGFQIENALTREQALRTMTIWAAKASFEESKKGSIEVGKSADFVLLDNDIMNCTEDVVKKSKVLKTILGGEVIYQAESIK